MPNTIQDAAMQALREQAANYNARWAANGGKLTSYACEHCLAEITVPCPPASLVGLRGYWESMKVCPHCGGFQSVKVYPNGKVIA